MRPKERSSRSPAALSGLLSDCNAGDFQAELFSHFCRCLMVLPSQSYIHGTSPLRDPKRQVGARSESLEPLSSSQTERQGQESHEDRRDQNSTFPSATTAAQKAPTSVLEPFNLVRDGFSLVLATLSRNSDPLCISNPSLNSSTFSKTCSQSRILVWENITSFSWSSEREPSTGIRHTL